eukprot:5370357-Amphidinium_carterae.4
MPKKTRTHEGFCHLGRMTHNLQPAQASTKMEGYAISAGPLVRFLFAQTSNAGGMWAKNASVFPAPFGSATYQEQCSYAHMHIQALCFTFNPDQNCEYHAHFKHINVIMRIGAFVSGCFPNERLKILRNKANI